MIEVLYEKMALPESCRLGKRVYKKLFHVHADLGVTDKKALAEDIDTVMWQYTLKPSTVPILPYVDEERDYPEIAVLQVDMKSERRVSRIAEIVHRAIPYPLMMILIYGTKCQISVAHKRLSLAERSAIVVIELHSTDWIDLAGPTEIDRLFLDSLRFGGMPQTNYLAFYSGLVDRVLALKAARLTGKLTIDSTDGRRVRLATCHTLTEEMRQLRAAVKNEPAFNRQVELNTKIKDLERALDEEIAHL
jgi:hypothetical protein